MGEGDVLAVLQADHPLLRVEPHHAALEVAGAEGFSERNRCPRHPVWRDGGPERGHAVVEILLGFDHCKLHPGSPQVGGQLEAGISTSLINVLLINIIVCHVILPIMTTWTPSSCSWLGLLAPEPMIVLSNAAIVYEMKGSTNYFGERSCLVLAGQVAWR